MKLQHIHPNAVTTVNNLIRNLVSEDENSHQTYEVTGRIAFQELRNILTNYGATFTMIPQKALKETKVVKVNAAKDTWMVDIDLWTLESVSDLTLSLTITIRDDVVDLFVDDLHVL